MILRRRLCGNLRGRSESDGLEVERPNGHWKKAPSSTVTTAVCYSAAFLSLGPLLIADSRRNLMMEQQRSPELQLAHLVIPDCVRFFEIVISIIIFSLGVLL